MFELIIMYVIVGALAGLLAGLFGIGGGLVIVPMLLFCFARQGIPNDVIMQIALATSMASICFTSVSSFRAHHRRGAVDWNIVKGIAGGVLLGTFLGSFVASALPTATLKVFFVIFLYYVATQMLLGKQPKATREIPGLGKLLGAGGVIGVVSALVGIGGGTLSVPFMVWHNVPLHRAIGTSAAIGFPIAVAGTLGYIVNGAGVEARPDYSLGYIYLPALLGIVIVSVITAPWGVKLAHSLPVGKLKKAFAILLYVVGTRMLINAL
ncbi:sulfite exporter TauE/SafE family protein [Megalodesulfovibrio paquesii]